MHGKPGCCHLRIFRIRDVNGGFNLELMKYFRATASSLPRSGTLRFFLVPELKPVLKGCRFDTTRDTGTNLKSSQDISGLRREVKISCISVNCSSELR